MIRTEPARAEVLVIGEALIDIVDGPSGRRELVGGSPANVALGVGRAGVPVSLLTYLGRDTRGEKIASHLRESNVAVLPGSFEAPRTSTAVASIDSGGSAEYRFDVLWNVSTKDLPSSADVVHTGSIAAFLAPGGEEVLEYLSRVNAREVTFDPNIRPALLGDPVDERRRFEAVAALCTVVKLSDEDAHWLYPGRDSSEVLAHVLALGPRAAAMTMGGDGAIIAGRYGSAVVAAVRSRVVDTIGAGDTFMASLITSLTSTPSLDATLADLEAMAEAAAHAAAITVGRAGADLPWAHELRSGS
ncbi:PfkB family carbohydrate kinase [Herbiconiux sp. L3-i23]|uniref:PfkB family carbohydrate kinase n=1 Tax=Herbiconiux sp. L3-i23 TaxID=2905871 RepID=UPI002071191F|nr:PfkB family carbohydrate kinase [Herbiconiux sp. L3-i23]BDI23424.1 ribokinase [Herbiconiux sp. L3-i23]